MGADTKIEWCDFTFNGWIGCTKVAAGCTHCYAEALAKRYNKAAWGPHGTRVKTSENYWRQPLKWNRDAGFASDVRTAFGPDACDHRPRPRVFCASLADVFEDWPRGKPIVDSKGRRLWTPRHGYVWDEPVPESAGYDFSQMRPLQMVDLRESLFHLIDATPSLDWLLLTKRPENVRRMWASEIYQQPTVMHDAIWRQNVWLGCSIATQKDADENIPELLKCRDLCPVLFASAEPLIEAVDITRWMFSSDGFVSTPNDGPVHRDDGGAAVDWLIIGGESGHGARHCEIKWIRSLIAQCKAANVPCFVKQLGSLPLAMYSGCEDDWEWWELQGIGPRDVIDNWEPKLRDRKGGDMSEWPEDLRVREFPIVAKVH
jgi:protein gp37